MTHTRVIVPHRFEQLDAAKPLTARQELYVQALWSGMSKAAAYRAAGYKGQTNTNRMYKYPNIVARLAQLKAEAADRHRVTADELTDELRSILDRCRHSDSAAAMQAQRAAVMNLAKMHGLLDGAAGGAPVCTCGGANRIEKIRFVIVEPDGTETPCLSSAEG